MRIVFDVRFPLHLSVAQRDAVRAALAGATYDLAGGAPQLLSAQRVRGGAAAVQ